MLEVLTLELIQIFEHVKACLDKQIDELIFNFLIRPHVLQLHIQKLIKQCHASYDTILNTVMSLISIIFWIFLSTFLCQPRLIFFEFAVIPQKLTDQKHVSFECVLHTYDLK